MNEINNIISQLNTFDDTYPLISDKDKHFKGLFLEVFAKYYFTAHHYTKILQN